MSIILVVDRQRSCWTLTGKGIMGLTRGSSSGCGTLPLVLFVVFLACKLAGVIDWSWWWVTAPLWLPPALVVAVLTLLALTGVGAYKLVSRSARAWVGRSGLKVWTTRPESARTESAQGEVQGYVVDSEGTEVPVTGADVRPTDGRKPSGRQLPSPTGAGPDESADGASSDGYRSSV